MIERVSADGPVYHQEWLGMKPTTPIISGGLKALRLPGFFENLGHGNLINTAGGGPYDHIDGPAAGARSLRQAYECWKAGAGPIECAKEHNEFARAFESFPFDADKLFPPAGATPWVPGPLPLDPDTNTGEQNPASAGFFVSGRASPLRP